MGLISSDLKLIVKDAPGAEALITGFTRRRKAAGSLMIFGAWAFYWPLRLKAPGAIIYTALPGMFLIGISILVYRDSKRQFVELIEAYNASIQNIKTDTKERTEQQHR